MDDNVVEFDRGRHVEAHWGARAGGDSPDYPFDDIGDVNDDGSTGHGLGDLLEVTVIDDNVVDVRRRSVAGTGYECAAMELGRGRRVVPPQVPAPPEPPRHEQVLSWLSLLVGGAEQLMSLDAVPLPAEEEIDLPRHSAEVRRRLESADHELARVTALVLGAEVRTAARRVLVRAVEAQSSLLRASTTDQRLACAALTVVAKANDLVGQGRVVPTSLLRTLFDLKSAPNDLVMTLTRAVAPQNAFLREWTRPALDVVALGSADFLVGSFREAIMTTRDAALHLRDTTPAGQRCQS